MTRREFEHEMLRAECLRKTAQKADYWMGYQRGLRRRFHGETFGTAEEHEKWLALSSDDDEARKARGDGYRAGFLG